MEILNYIGTILTWLLKTIAPNIPANVQVAIVALIIALAMWAYNKYVVKPKAIKIGIKTGAVSASAAYEAEAKIPISLGADKNHEAVTNIYKAINNPTIKSVDYKIEKAAKTVGGFTNIMSDVVSIINSVAPAVSIFKKK